MSSKFIGLIFTLFFLSAPLFGQNEVSFEAYADAKRIVKNSYFELVYTLKNADGTRFTPPSLRDFIVVSGPNQSMRRTIINGVGSLEVGFAYTLQPRSNGKFTIKPATIIVDGKILKSNPVQIEVVEGQVSTTDEEKQFFVEAIPEVQEAYVGQQILLDYKLFTTVDIESYNILEESQYQGFYAEDLARFNTRVSKEIIDNIQYLSRTLKRIALFPQQAGDLSVDPMQLQLGVADGSRSSSFFFSRPIKRVPAMTSQLDLVVKSLPPNAPPTFSGAVGKYKMATNLNRKQATTDDVLSLIISISGDGDVKRVQPPLVDLGDNFEVYDPNVKEEKVYELNGRLMGKKTYEYLVVPQKVGSFRIEPAFTYFDTDSAKYVTIQTQAYGVNIKAGQNTVKPAENIAALTEEKPVYIKSLMEIKGLHKQSGPFLGSMAFWIAFILPLLALLGVILYRRGIDKKAAIDPAILKRRNAKQVAVQRLEVAKSLMSEQKSRSFYDEISKAMIEYLNSKFEIPLSSFSKDVVRSKLEELEVKELTVTHFMDVLTNCEMALFAGKDGMENIQNTYDAAVNAITEVEDELS
ncbi:MAG: BatD family protein [Bacteroidota bacterium]